MPRIRTIKPEFFSDTDLSDLKFETRLLFIGLWTVADREGRLRDDAKQIKAYVFPHDKVNVEKGLKDLADKNLIIRYVATVAGFERNLIQVTTFLKHQRPHIKEAPSTYPAPTQNGASTNLGDVEHARKGREGNGLMDNGDGNGDTPPPSQKKEDDLKADFLKPPPDSAPPPPIGFMWIEDCLKKYFEDSFYLRTREQLCMARHCDLAILRDWAEAFNRYLTGTGQNAKSMKDWGQHFGNWLKLQNSNLNPQKLFREHEQGTTNNGTGNRNSKGGTIRDAFAAIDGMPD